MVKLIDVARTWYQDPAMEKQAMLLGQILEESLLLREMDFQDTPGSKAETTLLSRYSPATTRGINQGVAVSSSQTTSYEWAKSIISAQSSVDRTLIKRNGAEYVDLDRAEKMRSIRSKLETMLVKGDRSSNPTEFDGLQRVLGTNEKQTIAAGNSAGGDPLDLGVLDELYRMTHMPTHWIMNRKMATRFDKSVRNSAIVEIDKDDFGHQQLLYKGLPIVILHEDTEGDLILPFSEENPGGGTPASTSIYCVSIGNMGLRGIQTEDINILIDGDPDTSEFAFATDSNGNKFRAYTADIEWDVGYKMYDLRCAARAYGIADAPIVDN